MAMLKIYTSSYPTGTTILGPTSFVVGFSDLDSEQTTRTASGMMLTRDRVRSRVRKIDLEWKYLSRSQMATLLAHFNCNTAFTTSNVLVNDVNQVSVSVPKSFLALEYPDPLSASSNQKRIFYVSDRNVPMFNFNLTAPDGTDGVWESLSLSLIER